jgi:hypothetical protein
MALFEDICLSWRTALDAAIEPNERLMVFADAALQIASAADNRATAADQLFSMATNYLDGLSDTDKIQQIIADAFAKADETPKRKGNGKDQLNGLSTRKFIKMFTPPDFLIDGMLQRRFVYSLTGQTGHAKSAVALYLAELIACPDRNVTLGRSASPKAACFILSAKIPTISACA